MVRNGARWYRLRRLVQLGVMGLFLSLAAGPSLVDGSRTPGRAAPTSIFIRLDPLAALSSGLATQSLPERFVPSLILIAGTLLLGRAWCGWVCPLGTVLDLACATEARDGLSRRWRGVRFLVLCTLVGAAFLSNQSLMVLDPVTLLTRAVASGVTVCRWAATAGDMLLRGNGLSAWTLLHLPGMLPLGFLGVVVALNRMGHRFWCRALCPLGALLGLVARVSWLRRRIDDSCSACGQCARDCPVKAPEPAEGCASDPADCMVCLTCGTRCPTEAIHFQGGRDWHPWQAHDPTRRQVLISLAAGAGGTWLLRWWPVRVLPVRELIRPPGVREDEMLSRCSRCGECVRICPSSGLQTAVLEAGWEGVGTPWLIPRVGWCSYDCCQCGQVCPTGAIPHLSLEEKRGTVIGIAKIAQDRCIPWADLRVCTVCYDTCPLLEKAIVMEKTKDVDELGQPLIIARPRVLEERCIGCGVCEYNCPAEGPAAIQVYAV